MNKMLHIPLVSLFVVSIFLFVSASIEPEGETGDYSDASGIVIDGENAAITMPIAEPQEFNIWLIAGAVVIISIAVGAGIVSGIHVLGSGASEYSQKLLVISIIYLGVWAMLTVVTAEVMFDDTITTVTWLALTIMFALGMAQLITEGDEDD